MKRRIAEEVAETALEATPTWAVASVCFILILISYLIEHLLNLLAKNLKKQKKRSLIQSLEKIKTVLTLLGFITLLLTVGERPIAKICIPKSVGETFLPCSGVTLDESVEEPRCAKQGKVSLMSRSGVRELQFLVFLLAFFHSISSLFTFSLGMAKMRTWESWEAETRTVEYHISKDPNRFLLTHQTSFGKRHLSYWSESPIIRWPICFLRQFYESVSKVDYLTLRHGFIMAHFEVRSNFDFQKYIRRALENDFEVVVGISSWIWIFAMLFVIFNANSFRSYLWLPFIPVVMLLVVGTKLQGIITLMCLDSKDKSEVVRGALLVKPSDHFFWFGNPKLLLYLIHFILFQNSFQLAFITWTLYKFGFNSCFHHRTEDPIIKLVMGVLVNLLGGYVTLPLYALVTQMGTTMRKAAVFPETVIVGLESWRARAKKNLKSSSAMTSADNTLSTNTTPFSLTPSNSIGSNNPFSEHVAIANLMNDEHNGIGKQSPEYHKASSFPGFQVCNSSPVFQMESHY
ncbi:hypothetical protein K2173_001591 [Erythroxylum novogranatense]|uniref:MLO-like protein n=1 Tax=Erythroxylum novogranatense TaxID=1862640 RepID=A0AAV8T4J6_9ROSI|nr:hypothetical protein K2173_001591 [Erythroxylum novogranatense]